VIYLSLPDRRRACAIPGGPLPAYSPSVIDDDDGLDAIDEALARARALPPTVVASLFARYGRPLAAPPPLLGADERRLPLAADGLAAAIVRVVSVRTAVDVIANDWFVLEADGAEPLAVAGPLFAAALAALTRAARGDAKPSADAKSKK